MNLRGFVPSAMRALTQLNVYVRALSKLTVGDTATVRSARLSTGALAQESQEAASAPANLSRVESARG